MALQPDARVDIDRTTTAPFLLRLYWRANRYFEPYEFSVAPPADTSTVTDYSSLLPSDIRSKSVQIYTWPNCTLGELTTLFTSVLPDGVMPTPAVGTRLIFRLMFPDTRAIVGEGGRGKWTDKPLGDVVIGQDEVAGMNGDVDMIDNGNNHLQGDAEKTLSEARFVIGDYITCCICPPGADGRTTNMPPISSARGPHAYGEGRVYGNAPPHRRENGFGGGGFGRGGYRGGGYGGGRGGRSYPPREPTGDWMRGQQPPGPDDGYDAPRYGGGHRGYGRY